MQHRHKLLLAASGVVVALVVVGVVVAVVAARVPTDSQTYAIDHLLPQRLDPSLCPKEYGSPRPLLLVSFDGFRADYLDRGLSPSIRRLGERGVRVPYIKSVYPTKTFPNHYSIVTGLYPSVHGIVENVFYDPEFNDVFSIGGPPARNGSWWYGESIWTTLAKQGKKSATFFWPGSDAGAGGGYPDQWFPYNGSVPYNERVEQVLEWIQLPPEDRPAWISLYFDEPDRQGHSTGPDTQEVDEQIVRVDGQLLSLVEGLASKDLLHCVNLLIVADHGMAEGGPEKVIDLRDLAPNISDLAHVFPGASSRVRPKVPEEDVVDELLSNLSCVRASLRAFHKSDLPLRLHYTYSSRIDPIVLDLDPGYSIKDIRPGKGTRPPPTGIHGYDYYHTEMNALFVGYGPDLRQGVEVAPFQNIELYNVMCALVGVKPAPNNGTWGALNILASPPPTPSTPPLPSLPSLTLPEEDSVWQEVTPGCQGHKWGHKAWSGALGVTAEERKAWEKGHMPWGAPTPSHSTPLHRNVPALLHHHTHITGYSQDLKIPLWTSFSLLPPPASVRAASPVSTVSPVAWLSDPRLGATNSAACASVTALPTNTTALPPNTTALPPNTTALPLFPRVYDRGESGGVSSDVWRLVSNAGVMSDAAVGRWRELTEVLLPRWLAQHGPLNVVLGPVFDHDRDGHPDSLANNGSQVTPSDYFMVVTRCRDRVSAVHVCPEYHIRAIAFVYPHTRHPWTCANAEEYAREYSARVRDVELVTGLSFFTKTTPPYRLAITTAIHSNLWQQ